MTQAPERTLRTQCCIVGGGPAGMMLGLMLARAGVQVTVLEKHKDFLRDFRGDTVHPSTLEVLAELGLKQRFDALKQQRVEQISALFADGLHPVIDFRGLRPFPYLALVPQWDFLSFLAAEAQRYPNFDLRMQAAVTSLTRSAGRVSGVVAQTPEGPLRVVADLVVGCDGRSSTLREHSGLHPRELGAPMDVLWFRLPRRASDTQESFGAIGRGHFMALIQRGEYWQVAYIIPKGSAAKLQAEPIERLREDVGRSVDFLADRTSAIASWDDVKLLEVSVDRLTRWFEPGLLLIGDAAHAMSPIGGVGINLAIQDAVAAANLLAPVLRQRRLPSLYTLGRVQLQRALQVQVIQGIQVLLQQLVIAPRLRQRDDGRAVPISPVLDLLLKLHAVRAIPARVFGLGIRREHVAGVAA